MSPSLRLSLSIPLTFTNTGPTEPPEAEAGLMEEARIQAAAMNITSAFEGAGYHAYQTYDAGLISYGRFQFTLASGNLERLIMAYLEAKPDPFFTPYYILRIQKKEKLLRGDLPLQEHLVELGRNDPVMREVQDRLAKELFWDRMMDYSIRPRRIRQPLLIALAFDLSIQHGLGHDLFRVAEERLGIPFKQPPMDYSRTEGELCLALAQAREERLRALAQARNLSGLIPRGVFWREQAAKANWLLLGGPDGRLQVKPGAYAQVTFGKS